MNRRGFLRAVGAAGVLLGWHRPVAAVAALDRDNLIRRALGERRRLAFTYHGHARRVEPHALGHAKDGRLALLAWQTAGSSRSEPPPGWRTFIITEIEHIRVRRETFTPRPDYHPERGKLKEIVAEVSPLD